MCFHNTRLLMKFKLPDSLTFLNTISAQRVYSVKALLVTAAGYFRQKVARFYNAKARI